MQRMTVWREYYIEPLRAMTRRERPRVVDTKSQSLRLQRVIKTQFLNDELDRLIKKLFNYTLSYLCVEIL
jgi:hypothetical protein